MTPKPCTRQLAQCRVNVTGLFLLVKRRLQHATHSVLSSKTTRAFPNTNWAPLVLVPARNVREVFGSIRNKGCSNLGMRPQCSRVSARKTFFNSTLWELCSATKSSIILCDSAGVCDTGGGTSTFARPSAAQASKAKMAKGNCELKEIVHHPRHTHHEWSWSGQKDR